MPGIKIMYPYTFVMILISYILLVFFNKNDLSTPDHLLIKKYIQNNFLLIITINNTGGNDV